MPHQQILMKQDEVIMKNLNSNMMSNSVKNLSKLMMIPGVFLLGACSTTYTPATDQSSSYDFSSVKTYY